METLASYYQLLGQKEAILIIHPICGLRESNNFSQVPIMV
jgi:hypothetical protein